jgi:hypothetical protein
MSGANETTHRHTTNRAAPPSAWAVAAGVKPGLPSPQGPLFRAAGLAAITLAWALAAPGCSDGAAPAGEADVQDVVPGADLDPSDMREPDGESGLDARQDTAEDAPTDSGPDLPDTDTAEDVSPDADDGRPWACTPVGTSYSDGFFTLEGYEGRLYAGQFGYGHEARSMMFTYPPWSLSEPGLTGISESICAMTRHDGYLYANTESSGDIFRTRGDDVWERVYDGENGSIGCGMAALGGTLYAINYRNSQRDHGRILRQDGDAWRVVYDSGDEPLYLREIVTFGSTVYAFAVNEDTRAGRMLTSQNGTDWTPTEVPNRFFRGHVWNDALWLSSTSSTSNGEVAVWRFDGQDFTRVHSGTRRYFTDLQNHAGSLFAATSNGWKDNSGPSSLWRSDNGTDGWERVCEFSETAAWSLAEVGGVLYVGTWEFGGRGHVYEVSRVPADVDPTDVDCTTIAANPAWELCESTADTCEGVFTDGAGCAAFCGAAGLSCTARYGGEPGCMIERENVLDCNDNNEHLSDWCVCGR